MEKIVEYKPSETYNILKDIIESNDKIFEKGGIPISVSIIGERGIGKSTVQKELAQDLNRQFIKISLAQMTQPEELIGFYQRETLVEKGEDKQWITENLIPKYVDDGYTYTGKTRTISCPPSWIEGIQDKAIICLDDYSRGNQLFSQAIMELVNSHEMIGWPLKEKGVTVLLNENPDDGNYNVNSQDSAQTDRMAKLSMRWDAQDWAARAEKVGMDERLINFVLWQPELLSVKKQDGITANGVSPRMMDKFFSLVSTIDDFEKHLDKVSLYASITVGNNIGSQLTNFINKKLDKLPSIEKLLMEWDLPTAKAELTKCCGDHEKDAANWKSATAAILTTRMFNYARFYNKNFKKDIVKQYLELMIHPSFSVDQKYLMAQRVIGLNNMFSTLICADPRFIKYMNQ